MRLALKTAHIIACNSRPLNTACQASPVGHPWIGRALFEATAINARILLASILSHPCLGLLVAVRSKARTITNNAIRTGKYIKHFLLEETLPEATSANPALLLLLLSCLLFVVLLLLNISSENCKYQARRSLPNVCLHASPFSHRSGSGYDVLTPLPGPPIRVVKLLIRRCLSGGLIKHLKSVDQMNVRCTTWG